MASRRRFLGWVAFSVMATGILGVFTISNLIRISSLRVKVIYNLMARYIDETEEDFVLPNPALLRDLFREIAIKHPSLASMFGDHPTMMILIDGIPSQPTARLKEGNRIDLVPLFDGG